MFNHILLLCKCCFLALLEPNDSILGMSLIMVVIFSWSEGKLPVETINHLHGLHPQTKILIGQVPILKKHNPKLMAGFKYSGIADWKTSEIAKSGCIFPCRYGTCFWISCSCYPSPILMLMCFYTHNTARPTFGIILSNNKELHKKLNSAVFPGSQGGPLMHVIAAKAVCFKEALEPEFKDYISQVKINAKVMASTLMDRGIDVVMRGTENHIVLVDLQSHKITGKDAESFR